MAEPLQADALGDLKTTSNTLSVWRVYEDESNLQEVILALASTRQSVSNYDYALIGDGTIAELGISLNDSPGDTLVASVNALHCDLVRLEASQVYQLAVAICANGKIDFMSEKSVGKLLAQGFQSGMVQANEINPSLRVSLTKRGLFPGS